MYRECRSLQLPILVDMLLVALFLSSHVGGTGENGNDILLQTVGCSIIRYFAEFVGFVIPQNVPCCCILFL